VDAADQAGAEVREGFTVEEVVVDDSGVVTGVRGHGRQGGRSPSAPGWSWAPTAATRWSPER
jgi:flavin-dependent dehydrogenase